MTTIPIRIPPQNIDAEKSLLGSIMLRPIVINDILDLVGLDTFYVEKHRVIYRAMMVLFSKGDPIDLLTLSAKLKEQKEIDRIGGQSYLTEIINEVPSSANAQYYAQVVSNKFALRSLIEAATTINELGYNESEDIEIILDQAEKKIYEVTSSPKMQKFVGIKEILPQSWESMERLNESTDEFRGIPTCFVGLDNILAGLQKSDLIILAARPSMGKTSLALDIARQTALKHKTKVGIFSLEMSAQQLVDRMLSAESGVDSWKLRTGKGITEQDFTHIQEAMGKLSTAPIFIDDKAGNSLLSMRSTARRLSHEHGLDMIIIDYLQLITTHKHYDSMVNQVTEISRSLKALARELKVPVLALSQLSRAVESRGGKPRLSDLRDSGSIEQDADVVMFIHREDKYDENSDRPNIADILIEKHRNGPTGRVELYFDDKKTTFVSIEKSDFSDFSEDTSSKQDDDDFSF